MIVDTNALLCALGARSGPQTDAVRARVQRARESGETLTVLSATVLEAAYVLASVAAGFGWERVAVAAALEAITDEPGFDVEHASALRSAAATHRARAIDPHDCFLSALSTARQVRVLSFDNDFRRLGTQERP